LCSEHFNADDIKVNEKNKRLHPDAIPILHAAYQEMVQYDDNTVAVLPQPLPESSTERSALQEIVQYEDNNIVAVLPSALPGSSTECLIPEDVIVDCSMTAQGTHPEINDVLLSNSSPQPSTSKCADTPVKEVSTETSSSLSANTPRKSFLKQKVKLLTQQLRRSRCSA